MKCSTLACANVAPLKAPVVAAVGRVRRGSRRSVVHAALDDLRKRRENVSGSAGLEGRSRDRLEDGLAPLDAEGRHDGGSEGALRGRGQSVAHEGGAERGSHGDYGVVRAESGECCGGGGGGVVLHSAMQYDRSRRYTDESGPRKEQVSAEVSVRYPVARMVIFSTQYDSVDILDTKIQADHQYYLDMTSSEVRR